MQPDLLTALGPLLSLWPFFLGAFLLLIAVKWLTSARFKGWFGEWEIRRELTKLDPGIYQAFHDLYVPQPDGDGTTQIDHVVVSAFGIFVIETKNYGGWIFGSERQRQWTQQIYRNKFRFQNPLHQNKLHVTALMNYLGLPEACFQSVVFFTGEATFKTPLPDNVLRRNLLHWIRKHSETLLSPKEISQSTAALHQLHLSTDRRVAAKEHLADLRRRADEINS